MKKVLFYFLTLLIIDSEKAQIRIDSIKTIATNYMKAYGKWDYDKRKTFYAEDILFEDPTAKDVFKQFFAFDGNKMYATFLKTFFKIS